MLGVGGGMYIFKCNFQLSTRLPKTATITTGIVGPGSKHLFLHEGRDNANQQFFFHSVGFLQSPPRGLKIKFALSVFGGGGEMQTEHLVEMD